MATANNAHQVDLEQPFPVVDGRVFEASRGCNSGVVDQDFQSAPLGQNPLVQGIPVRAGSDIHSLCESLASRGSDCLVDFFGPLPFHVRDRHAIARSCIPVRQRLTETTAGASDDNGAGKITHPRSSSNM